MKTCKKILAGVLVFAMMLSMCAFVSADEVAEPTVTSKLVSLHSFDGVAVGTVVQQTGTKANTFAKEATSPAGGAFYLKSKANDGNATVVAKAEGDNYISATHTNMGYNHRVSDVSGVSGATSDYVTLGYGEDFPVIHTGYDIMIPSDDAYHENKRYFAFEVGTHGTKTYGSNVITMRVEIDKGKITGRIDAASDYVTVKKSGAMKYNYDEWARIDTYAWITGEKTMDLAIFADGVLIYHGTKNHPNTITGMATSGMTFGYFNNKSNTTVKATYDDTEVDPNAIISVTNYDNILVELLPLSSIANVDTAEVAEFKKILCFDGDKLATTEDTSSGFKYDAETGVLTGVAGKGLVSLLKSTGVFTTELVQSSSTKAAAEYKIDTTTTPSRTAFSATGDKRVYGIANVRRSLKSYINDGSNKTLVYTYDMYIPEGTEAVSRIVKFGFGYDVGSGTNDRKSNDLNLNIDITNNTLTSDINGLNFGSTLSSRVESREFTSNTWHTVKFVIDICWDAEAKVYNAIIYGTLDNDVFSVTEVVLKDVDDDAYSTEGEFDNLMVNSFSIDAVPPSGYEGGKTTTLYDNMFLELDNQFDKSELNFDAWVERIVEISKNASGNIDVYAKKSGDGFANGVLVIAIYNANGSLKELIPSSVIANGAFSYEVPAAKVVAGNIVKGFVFDSITSAIPQMEKGTYVVK